MVYAVLHRLLGSGSNIKWSDGAAASPLSRAVAAAAGSESAAASALNVSYSDSGLFGAVVVSPASVAGQVRQTDNLNMSLINCVFYFYTFSFMSFSYFVLRLFIFILIF